MSTPELNASCPLPTHRYPHVLMAHGGGGRLMHQLLENVFAKAFSNPILDTRHDSAQFSVPPGRLAMSTDSYVVRPLLFPGGDIGSMAVHGTVNDRDEWGVHFTTVVRSSSRKACRWKRFGMWCVRCRTRRNCGVQIITGDTKVVDKGKGDRLFINTTGIGVIEHSLNISPQSVQPGDAVVSGDLGRGIAIMAVRKV
jgi:hydrogenase expression/formation protein HypE